MQRILHHLFRLIYVTKKWFTRRFTPGGRMILLCLAASAVVGLDTKSTMAYQAFAFLFAIVVIAMVSSMFFRYRFSAARILPRFGTAGVKLEYRIVVHNRTGKIQSGLKLFENYEDPCPSFKEFIETPEPEERKRNPFDRTVGYYRWLWLISRKQQAATKAVELPTLQPNSDTEVVVEVIPSHRGFIRLTGLTVARPDPLGLFNACITFSLPQSLLILPKRYDLPPVGLAGTRRYQSGGVALASSVGESEEFVSMRDYRPGDPLRKIHWKSWAKTGRPVVKEYQDEFFVRHALILDTFQKIEYSETLEEAVSIAASFACEIQTQDSLLDLIFVGPEAYCFTSGRGLAHTDKMQEILAAVVACRDKSFEYLTPVVISRASMLSGCICILLCWDEERRKLVGYLKAQGIPILVLVITDDQGSGDDPDPGPMKDEPENFHLLKLGKIKEGLMNI
ncbi:MAG: DUF58 domain-containing protein [Deltaproteobacteria bacterium]|nr:MAG: DUF58 domain-containing protein [Deltaproteobacteria bacterium]